ncbi:MAG: ABC transporter ATP-binding protein, partial [Candidatus Levybacteria bacterium]|nr:ABC transporter ATP-binding protein [Candidatus Levybacteria bacterium]
MFQKVLEVKNLTKKFGKFTAVDNISFDIREGEILGLLGPNGAGKTTTIHMLLDVMDPTSGTISYFGKPLKQGRSEILKNVNFSSAYISLPWLFTVEEVLRVYANLYEVPNKVYRISRLLAEFEIEDLRKKHVYMLSAGEKARLLLTKAFINYPKIILLDEPTASLDPDIATKIREFLKKQQKEYNVSMLFTSHNMTEVEEMCDNIVFLNKGK